jgi:hypothetical protein
MIKKSPDICQAIFSIFKVKNEFFDSPLSAIFPARRQDRANMRIAARRFFLYALPSYQQRIPRF